MRQERELNTFWKDGGKGLPPEAAAKSNLARQVRFCSDRLPLPVTLDTGDRGAVG
jgi:hypothetical protein